MKILFVCTGNTCRSVMAEAYLKKYMSELKLRNIEIDSCGTGALSSFRIPEIVKKLLQKDKIDVSNHVPKLVNEELVNNADLILVMDKSHLSTLLIQYPHIRNKTFLLKQYAGIKNGDLEVYDPIGQSDEVYETCINMIKNYLKDISIKLRGKIDGTQT